VEQSNLYGRANWFVVLCPGDPTACRARVVRVLTQVHPGRITNP
jgi:hypothetical protein